MSGARKATSTTLFIHGESESLGNVCNGVTSRQFALSFSQNGCVQWIDGMISYVYASMCVSIYAK